MAGIILEAPITTTPEAGAPVVVSKRPIGLTLVSTYDGTNWNLYVNTMLVGQGSDMQLEQLILQLPGRLEMAQQQPQEGIQEMCAIFRAI